MSFPKIQIEIRNLDSGVFSKPIRCTNQAQYKFYLKMKENRGDNVRLSFLDGVEFIPGVSVTNPNGTRNVDVKIEDTTTTGDDDMTTFPIFTFSRFVAEEQAWTDPVAVTSWDDHYSFTEAKIATPDNVRLRNVDGTEYTEEYVTRQLALRANKLPKMRKPVIDRSEEIWR